MKLKDNYKILPLILIFFSSSSFFLGFYLDENSAGGGPGDYLHVLSNLQTFLNNSIVDGVHLTATHDVETYMSARTPLVYILHKLFNPFAENEILFRELDEAEEAFNVLTSRV